MTRKPKRVPTLEEHARQLARIWKIQHEGFVCDVLYKLRTVVRAERKACAEECRKEHNLQQDWSAQSACASCADRIERRAKHETR